MHNKEEAISMDKFEGFDPDSSAYVWENVYKKLYKAEEWDFWSIFNFNKFETYGNPPRNVICNEFSPNKCYFNSFVNRVQFGGETDFNFKPEKFTYYEKIIILDNTITDEYKVQLTKQLCKCNERHHSDENFSLMLKNGAMNNVKGALQGDRIDKFLVLLDDYFNHKSDYEHPIFSKVFSTYKDDIKRKKAIRDIKCVMKIYLDLFENIHDYAQKIYKIDETLVDKMISLGKRDIKTANDVAEYMNLAEEFWKQKKEVLKNKSK